MIPTLKQKLSEAAGREVVLWFMEEKTNDITKQVISVANHMFNLCENDSY